MDFILLLEYKEYPSPSHHLTGSDCNQLQENEYRTKHLAVLQLGLPGQFQTQEILEHDDHDKEVAGPDDPMQCPTLHLANVEVHSNSYDDAKVGVAKVPDEEWREDGEPGQRTGGDKLLNA